MVNNSKPTDYWISNKFEQPRVATTCPYPKGSKDKDDWIHVHSADQCQYYQQETARKAGWSDVLKILLTPEAKKYINEAFYCQVDFRDWVESQLHKLDEQLFKENT